MNELKKVREVKEAFKNYLSNNMVDMSVCGKIHEYVKNIENLTEEESLELDNFISDNLFDEIHLANIYNIGHSKDFLKKRFKRMHPFKISKYNRRIYEARGDIVKFTNNVVEREIRVKVKRKTYAKVA